MREAEGEVNVAPLDLGAVADTVNLELLRETLRGTVDGVGQQSADQAVARAQLARVALAGDGHHAVLDLHRNAVEQPLGDLALGAVGHEHAFGDGDLDAGGHRNRHLSYT